MGVTPEWVRSGRWRWGRQISIGNGAAARKENIKALFRIERHRQGLLSVAHWTLAEPRATAMTVVDIGARQAEIEGCLPVAWTVDTGFVNDGATR